MSRFNELMVKGNIARFLYKDEPVLHVYIKDLDEGRYRVQKILGPNRKATDEVVEEVCRLYDLGYTTAETRDKLNLASRNVVTGILKTYYYDREPRSKEWLSRINRVNALIGLKKRRQGK